MYIAYHPSYNHPVPPGHRFPMQKYDDVYRAIVESDFSSDIRLITPAPCAYETIELIHDSAYVSALQSRSLHRSHIRRIGFQLDEAILMRERYIVEGTLQVSLLAFRHSSFGFNIAGGTHHAFADRGEGFCIFNDFAVSAAYLLNNNICQNILIIDCDVHQGNGTAKIFQHEKRVFTFSIHGKNNFPFEKERSDLDIELEDGISDAPYLEYLSQSIGYIDSIFQADMLFYQCGVDILESDKMGKLNVSPAGCQKRDEMVFRYAAAKGIPVVCALGGGYSAHLPDIVNAHVSTFRAAQELLNK